MEEDIDWKSHIHLQVLAGSVFYLGEWSFNKLFTLLCRDALPFFNSGEGFPAPD